MRSELQNPLDLMVSLSNHEVAATARPTSSFDKLRMSFHEAPAEKH